MLGRVNWFTKDWQKSEVYSEPCQTFAKLFLQKAPK